MIEFCQATYIQPLNTYPKLIKLLQHTPRYTIFTIFSQVSHQYKCQNGSLNTKQKVYIIARVISKRKADT